MDPINNLVDVLKKFPGLGVKSSRRIVFYLLKKTPKELNDIAQAFIALKENLHTCSICGNVTDTDPCHICSDPLRDKKIICVVESVESLSAFEKAEIYTGVYHVLGERIIPFKTEDLSSECKNFLVNHVKKAKPNEIIIATNPVLEGDLTCYAVLETLKNSNVKLKKVTRLSQGLPIGSLIEFSDIATLHTSLDTRAIIDLK